MTIEFWGPIAVAVVASHRRSDLVWVTLAGAGVALLGEGFAGAQPVGLVLIVAAGGFWALYIVLAQKAGAELGSRTTPSGMAIAAVLVLLVPLLWTLIHRVRREEGGGSR